MNWKRERKCKKGEGPTLQRAQGIVASKGGISDPLVESLGFCLPHLICVLTICWRLSFLSCSWTPLAWNLESVSVSHQVSNIPGGKPSLGPLQSHQRWWTAHLWTSLLPRYRRGQRGGSGRQTLNGSHEQGGPYETCSLIRATQVQPWTWYWYPPQYCMSWRTVSLF